MTKGYFKGAAQEKTIVRRWRFEQKLNKGWMSAYEYVWGKILSREINKSSRIMVMLKTSEETREQEESCRNKVGEAAKCPERWKPRANPKNSLYSEAP